MKITGNAEPTAEQELATHDRIVHRALLRLRLHWGIVGADVDSLIGVPDGHDRAPVLALDRAQCVAALSRLRTAGLAFRSRRGVWSAVDSRPIKVAPR